MVQQHGKSTSRTKDRMMRDLLILGNGIHNLEMAEMVERVNRVQPTWNLIGFVSADGRGKGDARNGYPVVGGPEAIARCPGAALVPEFGWPREGTPRERLVSLIDPSAFVSRTATIGAGCVNYPNCFVGAQARIGDYAFVLSGCVINHDDVLEDGVTLASGVMLAGEVHVEADCYLGQACTVRQQLRIGRGSMIGMGAVVIADVPPGVVMAGNPARVLRER
jgi:sugar O-acyltransferase (sialic acid O-acetyltransferase NeuD family)